MENNAQVPDSPKPLAFTVDFGDGKGVDLQKHKTLLEKFQRKHRRGQSLGEKPPRKASFQSEGYFSSDEKTERLAKKRELSLPLRNADKMSQSFPDSNFLDAGTPDIQLKDVSSPELDPTSPFSPKETFIDGTEFDFDKSDTVSDAGTYTLDADNYSEEQKARMSIDAEFKIEQISVLKKTEDYIKSLNTFDKPKSPKPARKSKMLSPILSPTQNLSITQQNDDLANKTFTKIMFPSPKARANGLDQLYDQGNVISVTSSGAFRAKDAKHVRKLSLTKSDVQVEAYIGDKVEICNTKSRKLTANLVNVQSIAVKPVTSPSKIPSPIHTISRPRSRNSFVDLSDSSNETESYLKPTENFINSLQQRLSLDSDSELDSKYALNNSPHLLKQKASHIRHNSLDDKTMKISNKLEHFQTKNLQGIDQTYFNQYMHKIQNSPNNSPIRRSSSFSTKNIVPKNTNLTQEVRNSPNLNRNIQRSASTANIRPNYIPLRRASIDQHQKIDRTQFGDTESSSEEDFEKNLKKKDLSNLTNTRYNRAFSLRRGRLEEPAAKCPNTPEMRRKFQPEHAHVRNDRAISMDRKPVKTNEVQSRYLMNVTKKKVEATTIKSVVPKVSAKSAAPPPTSKPAVFSRTDSGRFSMRASKPPPVGGQKSAKKEGKKSSGRSNSSLSSREKEFQNWKRRKSYDPMKAAAEGKKKELMAKKQTMMTQSLYTETANQNQDCDSSPSHSSSVHRSQSFHGTAALEQLISSEEEEDLTLSADEEEEEGVEEGGFSPPTPSPCELSPARAASLRNAWKDRVLH